LELLQQWAQLGIIVLKYLDESGCYCQSPTDYSYAPIGKQKRVPQNRRRGRRVNIWGVWEPQASFDYALMLGTQTAQTYLKLMDWQAQKAAQHWAATGILTVIVQDNASVHRAKLIQQQWQRWQQQGLLIFFLPPYSPQMNRIEDEWLHLKRDELACRIFEDEYDLAMAIVAGVEQRANHTCYPVERFLFN
jgi:putative transposase